MRVSEFREIDARIPWASVVVLFGPNDSGKTNILDAVEAGVVQGRQRRVDRHRDPDPDDPRLEFEIELNGLDVAGHVDQELFVEWLRRLVDQTVDTDVLEPLRDAFGNLPPFEEAERTPEREEAVDDIVRTFMAVARDDLVAGGERACLNWPAVRADFASVVEACLVSRRFLVGWEAHWLAPRLASLRPAVRKTLAGLSERGEWHGGMPLVDYFSDEPRPLYESLADEVDLASILRVVRFDFSAGAVQDLYSEIEDFVVRELSGSSVRAAGRFRLLTEFARRQLATGDAWLDRDADWVRVHPEVEEFCEELGWRATEAAPPVVNRDYEIQVMAHSPDEWRRLGTRLTVRLARRGASGETFDLSVVSASTATWTGYAVAEAMRRMEKERRDAPPPPPSTVDVYLVDEPDRRLSRAVPTVFLIDEPERHLHPLAQEEVANWIATISEGGAYLLLATHATPFLRLAAEDVEYVRVSRLSGGRTVAEPISGDVLGAVEVSGSDLGLPPAAVIELVRAWLFVEGEDDRRVIDALFGPQLRQAGIIMLRFHGAARAKATFESLELVGYLKRPVFVVLDNVRSKALVQGELGAAAKTDEEKIAEQLVFAKRSGVEIEVFPFPYPDIICALPEPAVRAVMSDEGADPAAFGGWETLVADFEKPRAAGEARRFKGFALNALGLGRLTVSEFIELALGSWDGVVPDRHPLGRAISEMVARVSDRGSPVARWT